MQSTTVGMAFTVVTASADLGQSGVNDQGVARRPALQCLASSQYARAPAAAGRRDDNFGECRLDTATRVLRPADPHASRSYGATVTVLQPRTVFSPGPTLSATAQIVAGAKGFQPEGGLTKLVSKPW
jgi:hypothetical protein